MDAVDDRASFDEQAIAACRALLGEQAERAVFPAGRSRRSVRIHLAGRTVIATARRNAARAAHEHAILRALGAAGAPVPAVLAWRDGWLIQEDIGEGRLTEDLAQAGPAGTERLLDAAIEALARCQAAGRQVGLASGPFAGAAVLGATDEWRTTFAGMPVRLGTAVGIAPPPLDAAALAARVQPPSVGFIKWDARPGNAVRRPDGSVAWFDWEHAGRRAPLDDLVWLFGDEYVGDWPDIEDALLARRLGAFADGLSGAEARDYLATMLCLHACVRLALIVSYRQRDGRWWNRQRTMRDDRVGVDRELAIAVCAKAGRWAGRTGPTKPLVPWFGAVAAWFAALA